MPQSVLVQVGQCGNQCGFQFWLKSVNEYCSNRNYLCDEVVSHFFRPITSRPLYDVKNFEENVKARAILIDMEEGVIKQGCRGPLKELFCKNQILTDVSGSGNNWAIGNIVYGSKYKDSILNLFRQEAERCDSLQCFLFTFSVGGGTGSGLGTAALEYSYSEFPKTPRLVFAVYPSVLDDVVTSSYNAILASSKLNEYASSVIPLENKALFDMCQRMEKINFQTMWACAGARNKSSNNRSDSLQCKPFEDTNNIVAHAILEVTSSSRFPGKLNLDFNDIILNMTPFPKLKYLVSSISPLLSETEDKIDPLFLSLVSEKNSLFDCSLKRGKILAAAILGRGQVTASDIDRNIQRLSNHLNFTPWSECLWKTALCSIPPLGRTRSLFLLANSTEIRNKFLFLKHQFSKMYQRKAYFHHYSAVSNDMEAIFDSADQDIVDLIREYESAELIAEEQRLRPEIL